MDPRFSPSDMDFISAMNEKIIDKEAPSANDDIAIVGMAFRFPGNAVDEASFWHLLVQGQCGVTEIPASRWPVDLYLDAVKGTPGRSITFKAGVINDILSFEPAFFAISPREAEWMDPQQRLLLKLVYECFEDAGIPPEKMRGQKCGVFTGMSAWDYLMKSVPDPESLSPYTMTGNTGCIASNRISYFYDLEGPSFSLDTACSSGMTAIHEACESIRRGESSSALAAGVHLFLQPHPFIGFSKASMLSPNGRCLPFDDRGDGYVRSEGAAVIFLKRLSDAVKDGDRIHAVIRATGINVDGARKKGLTVPSAPGQADLMREVLNKAGIAPGDLDFVEAHGTGTPVGDPIEADSISQVYGLSHEGPLPITSVKANVGHLEPVSGFAGLIKAVLVLKHRFIPRIPFAYEPSTHIDFAALNIFCPANGLALTPRENGAPLMASVNSFGFGGANAHVILSEAPRELARPLPEALRAPQDSVSGKAVNGLPANLPPLSLPPLILTAFSRESLKSLALSWADFLKSFPGDTALRDYLNACHGVITRREAMNVRLMVQGSSVSEVRDSLIMFAEGLDLPNALTCDTGDKKCRKTAFVLSGNGSQYAGMGLSLYKDNPVFRRTADKVSELAEPLLGYAISDYLSGKTPMDEAVILDASVSQPLIFAVEAGILEILRENGFVPDGVVGHSMGEITGSYAAGKLSLHDAVKTIAVRSILQNKTRGMGGMAAASLSPDEFAEAAELLSVQDEISIAAVNSSANITVTGSHDGLAKLQDYCSKRRVFFKKLRVDYPFHSSVMDLIKNDIEEELRDITPLKSSTEFYSSVTGDLYDAPLNSVYWGRNVREAVLFGKAMTAMLEDGYDCFIEIAPTPVLQRYLRENVKEAGKANSVRISSALLQGLDGNSRMETFLMENSLYQGAAFWENRFRKQVNDISNRINGSENGAGWSYEPEFISLPHYKWTEKPYEVKPTAERDPVKFRAHPLSGWRLNTADPVFENILEPHKSSLLSSHKVDGECVFAAASFIETALEAHAEIYNEDIVTLEYLDIRSSLVFEPETCRVMELAAVRETGLFTVKSREYARSEAWTLHAGGRLVSGLPLPDLSPRAVSGEEAVKLQDQTDIKASSHDEVYDIARSMGLDYGPEFSLIAEAAPDPDTASLTVKLVSAIPGREKYIVPPGVMDAALQALLVTGRADAAGRLYLPVSFGRISFRRGQDVAEIKVIPGAGSSRSISADFVFRNAAGETVGVIKGAELRAFPRKQQAVAGESRVPLWRMALREAPAGNRPAVFGQNMDFAEIAASESTGDISGRSRWYQERYPVLEALTMIYALKAVTSEGLPPEAVQNHPLGRYLVSVLSERGLIDSEGRITPAGESLKGENTAVYEQNLISGDGFSLKPLLGAFRTASSIKTLLAADAAGEGTDGFSGAAGERGIFALFSETETPEDIRGEQDLLKLMAGYLFRKYQENQISQGGNANTSPVVRVLEIGSGSETPVSFLEQAMRSLFGDRLMLVKAVFGSGAAGNARMPCFDVADGSFRYDRMNPEIPPAYDLIVLRRGLSGSGTGFMGALRGLKALLAPEGILAALERYPVFYADMVSGRSRSWWQYREGRPVSPLKSPAYWEQALSEAGYENIATARDPAAGDLAAGSYLTLASRGSLPDASDLETSESEAPETPAANETAKGFIHLALPWADARMTQDLESSAGFKLLSSLSAVSGFEMDILDNGFKDKLPGTLGGRENPGVHKYVFLTPAGIRALCPELACAGDYVLPGVLADLTALAEQLASFGKGRGDSLKLLVVTQTAEDASGDRGVFGLARVIKNELPGLSVSSIMLDGVLSPDPGDAIFAGLCQEILEDSSLDEIVLRESGRYRLSLEEELLEQELPVKDNVCPEEQDGSPASSDNEDAAPASSPAECRYLDFSEAGRLKNLIWKTKKLGALGPRDLRVRVAASGLNFRDVMMTMGLVPDEVLRKGFSGPYLGLEFAGSVMETGSEVTEFRPGDRVFGLGSATLAETVDVPVYAVSTLPEHWSFGEGAGVPVVFFTAWYALKTLAALEKGERLLVHGAAGGVGVAAIQIARYLGLEVYATAGSPEKRDFLRLMGVTHIYNSRSLNFHDEVLRDTAGEGVDAVLNCLSGEAMQQSLGILRPFGRFIELGKRDFVENTGIGIRPLRENISYFAVDVDQLFSFRPDKARRIMAELGEFFRAQDSGVPVMRPLPYTVFPASGVIDAFKLMQQGGHIGKIVISMEDFRKEELSSEDMSNSGTVSENCALPEGLVPRELFTGESSWLITGGTRGFGLETACFLASQGAGRLILVSRSGKPAPEDEGRIQEIRDQGAEVLVRACNVADREDVHSLISDLRGQGIRLTGIIHAAAVFRDAFLKDMNRESYAAVSDPKYQGALNLHLETLDDKQLLFVMYSSVSVALGNIGQANYVAANAALEGLCAARIRSGLHAACAEWGPIGDAGYLTANTGVMQSLERSGGAMPLKSRDALARLPEIIRAGGVHTVAAMDWRRAAGSLEAVPARLHALSLRISDTMADRNSGSGLREQILGLSQDDAVKLVIEVLTAEVAETMGLSPEDIGADRNLHELGLDSLMAMDLVAGLEKKLGIRMSVMMFQDKPAVRTLAGRIYGKITGAGDGADEAASAGGALDSMANLHLTAQDKAVMADRNAGKASR